MEWNGWDWNGVECMLRLGGFKNGTEWMGTEWMGPEWNGMDRKGQDWIS